VQVLSNPHWLVASWLALETLLAFTCLRGSRDVLRAAGLGSALALVRPYDAVLAVCAASAATLATGDARRWFRAAAALLGLAPAFAYNYWVFYRSGVFPTYTTTPYADPPLADLAWALGPALLLAAAALRMGTPDRALRVGLWMCAPRRPGTGGAPAPRGAGRRCRLRQHGRRRLVDGHGEVERALVRRRHAAPGRGRSAPAVPAG
jgi:hypothetical protein